MQATSHRYADCTRGCDGSLEVSGFLWVGRGGGKEQAPDAICFLFLSFLLFGSGWAVCAVARWVNSISTIAWRAIPSPRDEGIFSRTLANRAPLAERSSYPRRRPAPLDQCRTHCPLAMMPRVTVTMALQPLLMGRRTLSEGGSYPRSFWARCRRIRASEDKVESSAGLV